MYEKPFPRGNSRTVNRAAIQIAGVDEAIDDKRVLMLESCFAKRNTQIHFPKLLL
ncbi:hypothetical protein FIC_02529 [Flavobacteriaceae bacterium 3519-10]|nr:hypothetical protein FIC_02529 [Flavobacteriaceae bacterium 3519-10]